MAEKTTDKVIDNAILVDKSGRMKDPPNWVKPFGMSSIGETSQHDDAKRFTDKEQMDRALLRAKEALCEVSDFKDEYVKTTFQMDFCQHHNLWRFSWYDWLPEIPKEVGDPTPGEYLANLQIDSSLLDMFEFLQQIAVGLEQVIWDQEDSKSKFCNNFKRMDSNLRAILNELQNTIVMRSVAMRSDVNRDVMGKDFRQIKNLIQVNFRDWIILREYINVLEYVVDVLEHFKRLITESEDELQNEHNNLGAFCFGAKSN